MVTYAERKAWEASEHRSSRRSDRVPSMSAAAQTRLTWARRIDSFDDVPEMYLAAVRDIVGQSNLTGAVLCPAFPDHLRRTNEHLVFHRDGRIHVLERTATRVSVTSYPVAGLHAVEHGDVLLDGWLTLRGRAIDGSMSTSTLRFNTVTMDLVLPFVDVARHAPARTDPPDAKMTATKLAWLRPRDFKFHALARSVVRPTDRVIDAIFQPVITAGIPGLPARLVRRTVAPGQLVLLTDTELIHVSDALASSKAHRRERYGSVRTFASLDHLERALVASVGDSLVTVRLDLPANDHLEFVADARDRANVERFVANLVAAAPHVASG